MEECILQETGSMKMDLSPMKFVKRRKRVKIIIWWFPFAERDNTEREIGRKKKGRIGYGKGIESVLAEGGY